MLKDMLILLIIAAGLIIGIFIGKKTTNKQVNKNIKSTNNISKIISGTMIAIVIIGVIVFLMEGVKEKIDVTGTTMLEYLTIIEKYGRDINFDGITSGANCYTGKQIKTVNSDKYGKVTVEFSYCKLSDSVYIHVYN